MGGQVKVSKRGGSDVRRREMDDEKKRDGSVRSNGIEIVGNLQMDVSKWGSMRRSMRRMGGSDVIIHLIV